MAAPDRPTSGIESSVPTATARTAIPPMPPAGRSASHGTDPGGRREREAAVGLGQVDRDVRDPQQRHHRVDEPVGRRGAIGLGPQLAGAVDHETEVVAAGLVGLLHPRDELTDDRGEDHEVDRRRDRDVRAFDVERDRRARSRSAARTRPATTAAGSDRPTRR